MSGERHKQLLLKQVKPLLRARGIAPHLTMPGLMSQVAEVMNVPKPAVYADQMALLRVYVQIYGHEATPKPRRFCFDFVPLKTSGLAQVIARETAAGRMNQWPSRIGDARRFPDGRVESCA